MKVLICGSRDWTDKDAIRRRVAELPAGTEIVEGGARGADQLAHQVASARGLPVTTVKADWERYGRSAGFKRNIEMLDMEPDLVLAFRLNNSRGTGHTIQEAIRREIPVEVINVNTTSSQ